MARSCCGTVKDDWLMQRRTGGRPKGLGGPPYLYISFAAIPEGLGARRDLSRRRAIWVIGRRRRGLRQDFPFFPLMHHPPADAGQAPSQDAVPGNTSESGTGRSSELPSPWPTGRTTLVAVLLLHEQDATALIEPNPATRTARPRPRRPTYLSSRRRLSRICARHAAGVSDESGIRHARAEIARSG
jgi:hypothetical protein